jgi:argininosuccinate synthase
MRSIAIPAASAVDGGAQASKSSPTYPDEPALVEINFDRGAPAAINGIEMPLVDLISSLGTIAAAHGVGRVEAPSPTSVAFETPAAVVLHAAHRALQARLLDDEGFEPFAAVVRREYPRLIADGRWFSPLREALDAFVNRAQEQVTGAVRMKLFKGTLTTVDWI